MRIATFIAPLTSTSFAAVIATLLVAAAALATPAAAQGPYRQDVVVTAAATPVELGTVTRTLTVITRDQIARLLWNARFTEVFAWMR